ncbi:MAG: hypothetical protein ACI9C9_002515 [Marivirga sp.]|jgi:hypothetical protein
MMFHSFKNREEPKAGERVRVYRNLNMPTHFSIMAMAGPNKYRVLGHAKAVHLINVSLKVSTTTREKVVLEKVRTVHAYADGFYQKSEDVLPNNFTGCDARSVTYQPFVRGYFFNRDEPEVPVGKIEECCMFGANCAVPASAKITPALSKSNQTLNLRLISTNPKMMVISKVSVAA